MNGKNIRTGEPFTLKVHTIGMGERGEQTLRVFFERQLGGKVCLSGDDEADAVLIDGDHYQSQAHLSGQAAAHPDRPVILLTLNPENAHIAKGIVVKKPINASTFAEQLTELARQQPKPTISQHFSSASDDTLEARFLSKKPNSSAPCSNQIDRAAASLSSRERHYYVGSMPDVDLNDTTDQQSVYYDPRNYLQGHFRQAVTLGRENGSVVRISLKACEDILIHPFSKKVSCMAKPNSLYAAARMPITSGDIRIDLLPEAPHFPEDGTPTEGIDHFAWKLALWASRGRLPLGTELGKPVYLRNWPNLTRLLVPPHSPRILGLWAHQAYSLKDTPALLKLPQRYVFALFSACLALDLTGTTQRAADMLVIPELPPVHERRSLFRMLLDKLTPFRNSEEQAA